MNTRSFIIHRVTFQASLASFFIELDHFFWLKAERSLKQQRALSLCIGPKTLRARAHTHTHTIYGRFVIAWEVPVSFSLSLCLSLCLSLSVSLSLSLSIYLSIYLSIIMSLFFSNYFCFLQFFRLSLCFFLLSLFFFLSVPNFLLVSLDLFISSCPFYLSLLLYQISCFTL